jgi:hypothetical protein
MQDLRQSTAALVLRRALGTMSGGPAALRTA